MHQASPTSDGLTVYTAAGLLLGAGAALFTSLSDFGAAWLWLQLWSDRGAFLVRLLTIQVGLGAVTGALVGALAHVVERRLEGGTA